MDRSISISNQIDDEYRKYALYVIQSRGIPNFYDSLTPVQRLILQNSPSVFKKTLGVVGEVFSTGLYHHGDSSLSQAMSKLARPFGCAEQILLGDGFFGSPVNPAASAPRYTQIKISPKYKELIEKYKDLNVPNEEGGFDWIHIDYPIGLSTHVVGIAVGYKSNILPRKPEDVAAYLNGNKTKKIKPHFKDFKGKITKMDSLKSSWLIEGENEIDLIARTFKINSISPLQRYESFFNKLNSLLERSGLNYKMDNFSTNNISISIKFRCTDLEFKQISERLSKENKQIVTENVIFVKDGNVVEYDCIEEYLEDFIVHREETILKRYYKDLVYLENDLEFLEAKLAFLIFMSEKKREVKEVQDFLSKYKKEISRRLESISLVKLTKEEIINTEKEIKSTKETIRSKKEEIKTQEKKFKEVKKQNSSIDRKNRKTISLMEDHKEEYFDGIKIWNPEEDEILDDEQIESNIENE